MKTQEKLTSKQAVKEIEFLILKNANLQNSNANLQNSNTDLQVTVTELQERLDWFQNQLFGKKSEKIIIDPENQYYQLSFDGFEVDTSNNQEGTTIPTHKGTVES